MIHKIFPGTRRIGVTVVAGFNFRQLTEDLVHEFTGYVAVACIVNCRGDMYQVHWL